MASPFTPDPDKLSAVRAALPAVEAGIYLNAGTAGPLPAEAAAAMADAAGWELRTGRAHAAHFELLEQRLEEVRATLASVIGAGLDEIALRHSTSEAISTAIWSLDWRPGDRAVTTTLEHIGGLAALYALRDRLGVELVFVDAGDGGDSEGIAAAVAAALDERTRCLVLSHVSWATGARLPVEAIAAVARERGIPVVVDGAQAVGAIPVSVADLGADFYAFAGHKWLLGPEGVAGLWVSPAMIETARPIGGGWPSFAEPDVGGRALFRTDVRRLDAVGWYGPAIVGLARSVGWLAMIVGWDFIHRRGTALARSLADRLSAVKGVTVVTPRHRMATLVTFRVCGWSAEAVLDELGRRIFVIGRTIPHLDAVRLSVGFYTTEAELDRVAETVAFIAAHTPATLPPRPKLPIVEP